MTINYSDDYGQLNNEALELMNKAIYQALSYELGKKVYELEKMNIELDITIVSAEEIREINSQYRGIDQVTDVLSFPQFESSSEIQAQLEDNSNSEIAIPIGDVVICYDRMLKQADEYQTGVERELAYLTTHSILHLLGYDHIEEADRERMRAQEEQVMKSLRLERK